MLRLVYPIDEKQLTKDWTSTWLVINQVGMRKKGGTREERVSH
jgi:hypothetical protein